ncbi:hypothetical protein [Bradyrhizobium sp. USDA 4516]
MLNKDFLEGFEAAKKLAEAVANDEIEAADKELNTVNLAAGQKERTQVRKKYAEVIARGIRKLTP